MARVLCTTSCETLAQVLKHESEFVCLFVDTDTAPDASHTAKGFLLQCAREEAEAARRPLLVVASGAALLNTCDVRYVPVAVRMRHGKCVDVAAGFSFVRLGDLWRGRRSRRSRRSRHRERYCVS